MPSQISGYEYDIFISYRHNDNKTMAAYGEPGWVTEFVGALALELDAVVKRSVSIYFDKNPRDGLLDTHDVDASLAPKIRSLIFIPILSRTYTDPESFAWRQEFQAFNKMVQHDPLGPTIRLLNGNVVNRVLPIQIHDLEMDDIKLFEDELKAKLRSIEFIFKAPGVSRPLRTHEEDPLKNANRISYRDQVNKAAHAVKDILTAAAHGVGGPGAKAEERNKAEDRKQISSIITGDRMPVSKTVTVWPFLYEGKIASLTDYGACVSEEVVRLLSKVKDIRVSAAQTAAMPHSIPGAAGLKGTGLTGTQSNGISLRGQVRDAAAGVDVQVDAVAETGDVRWSHQFHILQHDLPQLPAKICQHVVSELNLALREGEAKCIARVITGDSEAYLVYARGLHHAKTRSSVSLLESLRCLEEAVQRDPGFARAYSGMAEVRVCQCYLDGVNFTATVLRAKDDAFKALSIDPGLIEAFEVLAFAGMCSEFSWPDVEPLFRKVFAINPVSSGAEEKYRVIAGQLQSSYAKSEFEVSGTVPYFIHAYALLHAGRSDEALEAAGDAVRKDPRSFMAHRALGLSYLAMENYERAIESLETAATLSNRHQWLLFELMGAYTQAGRRDGALDIMEEVMSRAHFIAARTFQHFFPS